MLACGDDRSVTAFDWDALVHKTSLPPEWCDFFARRGDVPRHPECQRRYARRYLRSQAILRRPDGVELGVYTGDLSRSGLRLLTPVQLYPADRCRLRMPGGEELSLEIVRCRRFAPQCYECGAQFTRCGELAPVGKSD